MSQMDLGTLRGHVELDVADFDRKYGQVDTLLSQLERRQVPDVKVSADTQQAETRLDAVDQALRAVDGATAQASAGADTQQAETRLDAVDTAINDLDGATAATEVDADTAAAEGNLEAVDTAMRSLDGMQGEVSVLGDSTRAESAIGAAQDALNRVDGDTAVMRVDADTSPAEAAFSDVEDSAAESGDDAGRGMMTGILAGLASIPIVGAVVGIGQSIASGIIQGIQDGLNVELSRDLFSARTGLDADTAARFARAAGEAYANAFGESIEGNLDAARLALQQGLIDEGATQAQIQNVIELATGISDVFEYDVTASIQAAGQMLRTGLVGDAEEAFDLIGEASKGVISDDLMDTLIEYSSQFETLGLDGEEAMALIVQAMDNGARNTDLVADAFKEMGLRIREDTDPAREQLQNLGLDVDGIVTAFQEGGPQAVEAMDQVFDALRELEENGGNTQEVITNLFGGPGEDLGAAIFALDLQSAIAALGETEGAARSLLDTLGANAATQIESARRNIEVAADGIKGALAAAFSDEIDSAAQWVQRNRAPILEFFLEAADAVFDFAGSGVEAAASLTEGFGQFVSGVIPPLLDGLAAAALAFDNLMPGDQGGTGIAAELLVAAENARELGEGAEVAAETMRTEWGGALDDMQDRAYDFVAPEIMSAKVHDALMAMTDRVEEFQTVLDETDGTVEINGDTVGAEEAVTLLGEYINEQDGTVTINGQTVPAEEALDVLMEAVRTSEDPVTISATKVPAEEALTTLMEAVRTSQDDVTIGGNKVPAEDALAALREAVRGSQDDVTIGGHKVPAEQALTAVMTAIRTSSDSVTIDGNKVPAEQATADLVGWINNQGGWVDINPDATDVDNWRPPVKYSTVWYRAREDPSAPLPRTMNTVRSQGGWIDGLDDGGWVPGAPSSVDNVLWPLAVGGRTLDQPLAGGEYVVNAGQAQMWGPVLEAINNGVAQVTAPAPADGLVRQVTRVAERPRAGVPTLDPREWGRIAAHELSREMRLLERAAR